MKFILLTLTLLSFHSFAQAPEIFEGGWENGVTIQWICPKGTQGQIPFLITIPNQPKLTGILKCGVSI
jgi:hypothetical protein